MTKKDNGKLNDNKQREKREKKEKREQKERKKEMEKNEERMVKSVFDITQSVSDEIMKNLKILKSQTKNNSCTKSYSFAQRICRRHQIKYLIGMSNT